jgi:hypothetical protein
VNDAEQTADQATSDEPSEGSQLRQALTDALAENKRLKARRREVAIERAGFGPEHRFGPALRRVYDGPPDPDKVRKFAAERYGIGQVAGD